MHILIYGLVIGGIIILAAALIPVTKLIRQLAAGTVRSNWILLAVLICLFILGYFAYAATFQGIPTKAADYIVPAIFFLGAWFVLLVSVLSLQTAIDIKRISILEGEVISDPLMGIYNRRYLERRLVEEIARARRYNLPLATLLIDLDRFKTINDTHGHPTGDRVLCHLGKLITDIIRASDIAARYGGDEILVISPNTTAETAGKLAERLRHALE
jgi:GGDEF domain-containing protein